MADNKLFILNGDGAAQYRDLVRKSNTGPDPATGERYRRYDDQEAVSGESYTGYFKITDITDRTNPESPIYKVKISSGVVRAEGFYIKCGTESILYRSIRYVGNFGNTELTLLNDDDYYILVSASLTSGTDGSAYLQIVMTKHYTYTTPLGTNAMRCIGRVVISNGQVTITQQHFGEMLLYITGGWPESNSIPGTVIANLISPPSSPLPG